jgi:hypothetical protein
MRNFLALLGAALVAFLVVGWYLGWYQISNLPSPNGKQSVNVSINSDKITQDIKKGGEMVEQFRDKKTEPEAKPGPATNFFTPTSTEKSSEPGSGWKPIKKEPPPDDGGIFGFRVPKN